MDDDKQELIREWLLKAYHDLIAARILAQSSEAVWEVSLYHCQQAAEKALKGFLAYWDCPIKKTHNLVLLLESASQIEPCFDTWEQAAARLTPYSTAYRYPEGVDRPDLEQVTEALDDAATIFNQAISFLPADVRPDTGLLGAGSTDEDSLDSKPDF